MFQNSILIEFLANFLQRLAGNLFKLKTMLVGAAS